MKHSEQKIVKKKMVEAKVTNVESKTNGVIRNFQEQNKKQLHKGISEFKKYYSHGCTKFDKLYLEVDIRAR